MLPIWLSFIRLVRLLCRRITFGDAALVRAGYILVGEGVYMHGSMLSAVPLPQAEFCSFELIISFVG